MQARGGGCAHTALWEVPTLSAAGRLQMVHREEVETLMLRGVDVYMRDAAVMHDCVVVLTSHRLAVLAGGSTRPAVGAAAGSAVGHSHSGVGEAGSHFVLPGCCALHRLAGVSSNASLLRHSKRVNLAVLDAGIHAQNWQLRFSNAADRDVFLAKAALVLRKAAWAVASIGQAVGAPATLPATSTKAASSSSSSSSSSSPSTTVAGAAAGVSGSMPYSTAATPTLMAGRTGVAGIMRRQEEKRKETDAITQQALGDLNALMDVARDAVAIIERYAARTEADSSASAVSGRGGGGGGGQGHAQDRDMQAWVQNIGIVTPVTKDATGSLYHEELARQISDILSADGRLDQMGGMINLPDLYCLYNRARGMELVSPDDLVQAACLLAGLRLGMSLRRFESGVSVIQSDSFSDDAVCGRILSLAREKQCIAPITVAQELKVSLTLAREYVELAERMEHLCRDESAQGTLFFPNRFPEFVASMNVLVPPHNTTAWSGIR